jgi:uncharacterized protein (TIGR02594 family)
MRWLRRLINKLFKKQPTIEEIPSHETAPVEYIYAYDEAHPTDPLWLRIAFEEIGIDEMVEVTRPRIVEYHSHTTLRSTDYKTPWCASFVCWCLYKAGIEHTRSAAARSYLNWGYMVMEPARGDIVVLTRGNSHVMGHVAFYLKEDETHFYLLGGNQSRSVRISKYRKDRVVGIRTFPRRNDERT